LPLIVKGARQVGKTEAIRHFAEAEYQNYIEINFVERPEFELVGTDPACLHLLHRYVGYIAALLKR